MQVGLQPHRYQYRCQARRGVPAAVHSYYKVADEDPTPHVAGFLLGREEQWYYLGSTGWWDGRVRPVALAAAELATHSVWRPRACASRPSGLQSGGRAAWAPQRHPDASPRHRLERRLRCVCPPRWDSSYRWSPLYDSCGRRGRHMHVHMDVHVRMRMCMCMYWVTAHTRRYYTRRTHMAHSRCGRPLSPAAGEVVFTRAFEGCRVSLDCTNASKCVGNISFSDEPERAPA